MEKDKSEPARAPNCHPAIMSKGECILVNVGDQTVLIRCQKVPVDDYRCWLEVYASGNVQLLSETDEALSELINRANKD